MFSTYGKLNIPVTSLLVHNRNNLLSEKKNVNHLAPMKKALANEFIDMI